MEKKQDEKDHSCLVHTVWDGELTIDDEEAHHEGKCEICGKKFHEVFVKKGIWDVQEQEWYLREF